MHINELPETPGYNVEMYDPRGDSDFDEMVAGMVARASVREDMREVTVDELHASEYIFITRYVSIDGSTREPAGYLRQLPQRLASVSLDGVVAHVNELGSMWVSPKHRGRRIAAGLVRVATDHVQAGGQIPIAVCNPHGLRAFEENGYDHVGTLPADMTKGGRGAERRILLHPPLGIDRRSAWPALTQEVAAQLRYAPRFNELVLREVPAERL